MASMATMRLGSKTEIFQRLDQTWTCSSGLPSDIVVQVDDESFNLHKFPLLSKSGKLEKMIAEAPATDGAVCTLQLTDLPGGARSFELVVRFCYGVKLELNTLNIVLLRCAAEQLQMTEEYGEGNLIAQAENFLDEIFARWKDTMKVLETCKEALPLAEELSIVSRCINSLAAKAHADSSLFSWPVDQHDPAPDPGSSATWNGIGTGSKTPSRNDWWYEDVCTLNLPMYKMFISAAESRGMEPESIGGSLMMYAKRHLAGLSRHTSTNEDANHATTDVSNASNSEADQRALLEEIANLLPMKKGVTSAKHLLGLLRFAVILKASASCRDNLEKRAGVQLHEATLEDILMPNLDRSAEMLYDIDCVQRILDHYLLLDQSEIVSSPSIDEGQLMTASPVNSPLAMVAKLIDGYLAEVASDANLKFFKFQSLAAAIPDSARPLDDGLYRAIDMYLKMHPTLLESEREQLCHLMNCQKLSLEACTHAAQNERLPLRMVVQVLFFEQLRLRTSIAGWFYVSDNLENPRGIVGPQKRGSGCEITQEIDESGSPARGSDVKSRVMELEKECTDMKMEIKRLATSGKWTTFTKKLGLKSMAQSFCEGKDGPIDCYRSSNKSRIL